MDKQSAINGAKWFLDQVLPPTCSGCGVVVAEQNTMCGDCWGTLTFIGQPCCDACGHPFEYLVPDRTLCGACTREYPPFDHARTAVLYDAASKDLILGFKHADKTDTQMLFAKWMMLGGGDLVRAADFVAPVPLHWTRLFSRRYNQAALLAQSLGKLADKPVLTDLVIRHRKTPSQGHLGVRARARNVTGAFRIAPQYLLKLKGKRVLLVDDVYTTGATVRATAKVLKRAGAVRVDVLTLARVVKGFVS